MSDLPGYSRGQHQSAQEVSDSKEQPPGYGEVLATRQSAGHTYAEKITAHAVHQGPRTFVIHATENNNFVLLDSGQPQYFVDNSSSLSKVIIRKGGDTRASVISMGSIERPFVKEVVTHYSSKSSGCARTLIEASGKFSVTWTFTCDKQVYSWKSTKGSWTCSSRDGRIAVYNAGQLLEISESGISRVDVIVSTIYAIEHFERMTSERRQRALDRVSGRTLSGPGALLGGSLIR